MGKPMRHGFVVFIYIPATCQHRSTEEHSERLLSTQKSLKLLDFEMINCSYQLFLTKQSIKNQSQYQVQFKII